MNSEAETKRYKVQVSKNTLYELHIMGFDPEDAASQVNDLHQRIKDDPELLNLVLTELEDNFEIVDVELDEP